LSSAIKDEIRALRTNALIKKGLRPALAVLIASLALRTNALIKKGLRQRLGKDIRTFAWEDLFRIGTSILFFSVSRR
jgi:hypothetical protein